MRFTHEQLRDKGYIVKDNTAIRVRSKPKPDEGEALECVPRAKKQDKGSNGKRIVKVPGIRVVLERFALRPVDTDNVYEKYAIDALRFTGLIPDDSPDDIELLTRSLRCYSREEERVVITLSHIDYGVPPPASHPSQDDQ